MTWLVTCLNLTWFPGHYISLIFLLSHWSFPLFFFPWIFFFSPQLFECWGALPFSSWSFIYFNVLTPRDLIWSRCFKHYLNANNSQIYITSSIPSPELQILISSYLLKICTYKPLAFHMHKTEHLVPKKPALLTKFSVMATLTCQLLRAKTLGSSLILFFQTL